MPADGHGGAAFTLTLQFSEEFPLSYRSLQNPRLTAAGGTLTTVSRVTEGENREWNLAIEPEGSADVTVTLAATADCEEDQAICNADQVPLSAAVSVTVAAESTMAGSSSTLTVADAEEREGPNAVLRFPVTLTPASATEVTVAYATADGTATAGSDYTATSGTLSFEPGETSKTIAVPITDDGVDDGGETFTLTLSSASGADLDDAEATGTIQNRETPLTASFEDVPSEHDGSTAFTFRLRFSEQFPLSWRRLQDPRLTVAGGTLTTVSRGTQGENREWNLAITPDGSDDVTVTLAATAACAEDQAICTANGRPLSHSLAATVAGPVGISVGDARVEEAEGALTVDYNTADGSAQAGVDYTAASGTLTFQAGESSRTIEVAVIDDDHDEGEETLTLTLSNASGGRLSDAEATGTIKNSDPLPRALVARFGRTAAVHVVEHVEERLAARREPGFEGRFAGRALRPGMERELALNVLSQLGASVGANPRGAGVHDPMAGSPAAGAGALGTPGRAHGGAGMAAATGPMDPVAGSDGSLTGRRLLDMGLGGGDVLTGSAFSLTRETRQGGILSFWSRGARSHFSGQEGALSLGGDVRTTMVGADYATGPLVAGLSLSHSRGLGEYAGVTGGQVASAVTGLYPWLGYQATDRLTVWGVAGYGAGGLLLTPDGGPALESGLSMAMAAAGTRGELVTGGAGGFELAFKADALWVGTSIDGVDGPAGRLAATEAAVTRFRTGLEGSRDYTLAGRLSLRPSVEVGLRHDGGDAETGAGMDIGGGLIVSDASTGLTVDVRVRTLLVHQAEAFRERGMAVSFSYNPTPSTPLGLTARVAPSWGGQAASGAEALWGRETMAGLAHGGVADGTRLDAELGYGLPVGSRFVGTPTVGVGTSAYGRDYRLGYRLGALGGAGTTVEFGVDAQRRESPLVGGTDHGARAQATVGW